MKSQSSFKIFVQILFLTFYTTGFAQEQIKQEVEKHFPQPKNANTYVVAHRGTHIDIPENTLAAYQKAIDLGCDFVEIDLRKTKDGRFVSVHNSTIDAYTNGEITGKVGSFTLAELKNLNIGKQVGPEWVNERIPHFEVKE